MGNIQDVSKCQRNKTNNIQNGKLLFTKRCYDQPTRNETTKLAHRNLVVKIVSLLDLI